MRRLWHRNDLTILPYKNANPYDETPFTDITDTNAYYYDAACWALDKGITTETTFKPFNAVSREETAAFLFRYASENGLIYDENYKSVSITDYKDYSSIRPWAYEAMQCYLLLLSLFFVGKFPIFIFVKS